jgi:hypothetical protein
VTWTGPEDNATLTDRVLQIMRGPAAAPAPKPVLVRKAAAVAGNPENGAPKPSAAIQSAGQDPFYIVRDTDTQVERFVLGWEALIRIKGSRQMGKTTLLSRAVRCARENGAKVALTDYQSLNPTQLSSVESLYKTIAESILDSLDLDTDAVDQNWNGKKPPNWNLERIMKKTILPAVDGHLVWAMDEVERVFRYEYAPEFFRLIRSWCSLMRTQAPAFEKLTVVMAYATEAHLFLPDPNESPFNLGKELLLSDFDFAQTAKLNERVGSPVKDTLSLRKLYELLGGQPFLTREALDWLTPSGKLALLMVKADAEGGPFGDHLRWLYAMLAQHAALARAVRAFLTAEQAPSEDEFFRLRSAGVFAGDSADTARIRCGLYESYLRKRFGEVSLRQGA